MEYSLVLTITKNVSSVILISLVVINISLILLNYHFNDFGEYLIESP